MCLLYGGVQAAARFTVRRTRILPSILSERMLLALGREQGLELADIYRRSFYDSLLPTVNSRFL
jgi:hypothetical protein